MTMVAATPQALRRPGHTLRMVSTGNADHALATLIVGQIRQTMPCTANLEGTDRLEHLGFTPNRYTIDFQRAKAAFAAGLQPLYPLRAGHPHGLACDLARAILVLS